MSEERLEEVIHDQQTVPILLEALKLPGTDREPPLAIQRVVCLNMKPRGTVILVDGFAQNRYSWRVSQRSFVGWLAQHGFEVLVLELRGHGMSRAYGAKNASCLNDYVEDLVRLVQATQGAPFVIGHSLGGAVAIGASTRVTLAGLIPLAGVYVFATRNRTLRLIARVSTRMQPVLMVAPFRMSTGWAGSLIARLYSMVNVLGYGAPIAGWTPGSVERDVLEERVRLGFDWTSVEVWLQMARLARGEELPYAAAFRDVDVPLYVIAGDQDRLLAPEDAQVCFDEAGSTDKTLTVFNPVDHQVHWGHLDLVLGRYAPDHTWTLLHEWMSRRA